MICALLLGREGSHGFPGKNVYPVLGRPLVAYPLMVAKACSNIDRVYVSTDSNRLKEIAKSLDCFLIDRPRDLASKSALGEDAFVHGYKKIKDELASENRELELVVLLFANAPTLTPRILNEGISILREHSEYDSAVSVSCYNMWSPLRARKINDHGLLDPFVPFETFGDPAKLNCDRDSQGDVWFADMGLSIVRPRCLDDIGSGLLPQKWMGQKIYPLKQWGGLDVDESWQIPSIEAWLQSHEVEKLFSVTRTAWENFYESERAILSLAELNSKSKVLDLGEDPGGLGLALRQKFEVQYYDAVQVDDKKRIEAKIMYPTANYINSSLEEILENSKFSSQYNAVISLNASDQEGYFNYILPAAYNLLCPGGVLIFSCRVTEVQDEDKESYIETIDQQSNVCKSPYVVKNVNDLFELVYKFNPEHVAAYGYSGKPSSLATTKYNTINFVVFSIKKPIREFSTATKTLIQLPEHLLKNINPIYNSK